MANFKTVNKVVKAEFPTLDIEVVRCKDYVYFDGADGFDKIEAIYCHPVNTTTEDLIRFCIENLKESLKEV